MIGLKIEYAKGDSTTDCVSENYFKLNNCGYYIDIGNELETNRRSGRSDYQIICVTDGEMKVLRGSDEITAGAGSCLLFRPGEPQCYRVRQGGHVSFCWMHFTGKIIRDMLCDLSADGFLHSVDRPSRFLEETGRLVRLIREGSPETYINGLAICLISEFFLPSKSSGLLRTFRRMEADIDSGIFDRDFAKFSGLSQSRFIRLFKSDFGITPHACFTKLRMERAAVYLRETSLPIGKIAELVGYPDQFYFCNLFRRYSGEPPSSFRKNTL